MHQIIRLASLAFSYKNPFGEDKLIPYPPFRSMLMKTIPLKKLFLWATTLFVMAFGMQAQAYCWDNKTLTTHSPSPTQFDVYHFKCPAGTTGVSGRIAQTTGTTGAGEVAMEIGKGNARVSAQDTGNSAQYCNVNGGVSSGYTSVGPLNAGPGTYIITISKDSASNATYDFSYYCLGNDISESPTGVPGADYDQPMDH
jgi:hypothetical protein